MKYLDTDMAEVAAASAEDGLRLEQSLFFSSCSLSFLKLFFTKEVEEGHRFLTVGPSFFICEFSPVQ